MVAVSTTPLVGRLLSADLVKYTMGCSASNEADVPPFGGLVRVCLPNNTPIFGIVFNILVREDGLVRQLTISQDVPDQVISDTRANRIIPLEVSILAVGYQDRSGAIRHLVPPRPPLSLDAIYACTPEEVVAFTAAGFGYFRHIINFNEANIGELLASHLEFVQSAQQAASGDQTWQKKAVDKVIDLLRDDYTTLNRVLVALSSSGMYGQPEDDFDVEADLL